MTALPSWLARLTPSVLVREPHCPVGSPGGTGRCSSLPHGRIQRHQVRFGIPGDDMETTFTVYFDGQFWIGVLEQRVDTTVRAVKVTFGPEPSDAELYEWLREHGNALCDRLAHAAPLTGVPVGKRRTKNPKRMLREAARAAKAPRFSTAAQLALKADQDRQRHEKDVRVRQTRRQDAEQSRTRRRKRARARHRGH